MSSHVTVHETVHETAADSVHENISVVDHFVTAVEHAAASDHHGHSVTFEDVLALLVSVACVWLAGKAVTRVGLPSLVGEIGVGVVLGPPLLNLVPVPEALMLFGEVGLMLLVLEAGLDVDLEMLKLIGLRGVGIAVTGSFGPLLLGAALSSTVLGLGWQASLAVGCTLAPTSMGIALNVLKRAKVLNTPTGQLIIAAAVLDDVIALILLSELQALSHPTALHLVTPVVSSLGLMLGIGWVAVHVVPQVVRAGMAWVPAKRREKVLLGVLLTLAIVLVPICHAMGSSPLLGAFLAGLSFCTDRQAHQAWQKQVKRVLQWLLKIFFAASIGFEVPIRSFADATIIGHASLLMLAVAGKFATGLWVTPLRQAEFLTVGLAMSAWGEFAFITATTARSAGLMDSGTFSSVILAVVASVVIAPTLLRLSLQRTQRSAIARIETATAASASAATRRPSGGVLGHGGGGGGGASPAGSRERRVSLGGEASPPVCYHLLTLSAPAWGLNARLMRAIASCGLEVLDFRSVPTDAGNSRLDCPRGWIQNEVYLEDTQLGAPPLPEHALLPAQQEALRSRQGGLLRVLSPLFSDGGKVELERWLPQAQHAAGAADAEAPTPVAAAAAGSGGSDDTPARDLATSSSTHSDVPLRTAPGGGGGGAGPSSAPRPRARPRWWWMAPDEEQGRGYKETRPTDLQGFISRDGRSTLLEPSVHTTSDSVEWATPATPELDGLGVGQRL